MTVGMFISIVSKVFAQSYYHSPNDTLSVITTVDNSVTLNITQIHTKNDTIIFRWKKLSVDMPVEWNATICDNNTCYPSLMDSATMIPAIPNENGLMLVHCLPNIVAGKAIIRYTIFASNTPEIVDTLTWIIEAKSTANTKESASPKFVVTGNKLVIGELSNVYQDIIMTDLRGTVCLKEKINHRVEIQLPDVPNAMYLLEIQNSTNTIQQKIWYPLEK